jgi:hypothetical protein
MGMMMQQIEDANGTTAEVATLGGNVELNLTDEDHCLSLVLTPRQARALARQLLQQADAEEYGEE